MYLKHFGLSEIPYKIVPDPRFLWCSDQHKEAKAKIQYHIRQRDGPVYLSADVGLGKTSIAQRLHDEIATDRSKQVVLAFAPNLRTANQFIRFISQAFDVKTANEPMPSYAFCSTPSRTTNWLLLVVAVCATRWLSGLIRKVSHSQGTVSRYVNLVLDVGLLHGEGRSSRPSVFGCTRRHKSAQRAAMLRKNSGVVLRVVVVVPRISLCS